MGLSHLHFDIKSNKAHLFITPYSSVVVVVRKETPIQYSLL